MTPYPKRRWFKIAVCLCFIFYGISAFLSPDFGTPNMVSTFTGGVINGRISGAWFIFQGVIGLFMRYSVIRLWIATIPMLLYTGVVIIQTWLTYPASLTPVAGLIFICALIWAYVYEHLGELE